MLWPSLITHLPVLLSKARFFLALNGYPEDVDDRTLSIRQIACFQLYPAKPFLHQPLPIMPKLNVLLKDKVHPWTKTISGLLRLRVLWRRFW